MMKGEVYSLILKIIILRVEDISLSLILGKAGHIQFIE